MPEPDVSVVIITPDDYESIRTTMRHLQAQTVRDRLEVVIVAPSAEALCLDEAALTSFARVQVVEAGAIRSRAQATAAGIRRATASVVAAAENHAYPAAGWAEALLAAHRQPWAAVGPVMVNANPASLTSWVDLFLAYGHWIEPGRAGAVADVPGQNSAYKRALLLDYGDELGEWLERPSLLHQDLRARGFQLYLEPAARIYHLNVSRPVSCARQHFGHGRLFAAGRVRRGGWSRLRRLLYVGGAPLIPLLHLRRILGEIRAAGKQQALLPGGVLLLLAALVASAAGEAAGYARGAGNAMRLVLDFELYRHRHITVADQQALFGRKPSAISRQLTAVSGDEQ